MIKAGIVVITAGALERPDKKYEFLDWKSAESDNGKRLHSDQTLQQSFICLIQELAKDGKTLTTKFT